MKRLSALFFSWRFFHSFLLSRDPFLNIFLRLFLRPRLLLCLSVVARGALLRPLLFAFLRLASSLFRLFFAFLPALFLLLF